MAEKSPAPGYHVMYDRVGPRGSSKWKVVWHGPGRGNTTIDSAKNKQDAIDRSWEFWSMTPRIWSKVTGIPIDE